MKLIDKTDSCLALARRCETSLAQHAFADFNRTEIYDTQLELVFDFFQNSQDLGLVGVSMKERASRRTPLNGKERSPA